MSKNLSNPDSFIISDFSSQASEAIQKLQTNISFAAVEKPLKVIAVTSAIQSEGKSTLAVNLANIYAERGAKVCLVNFDLRRPSLHMYYHVKNTVGIQELAAGEATLKDIIVHLPNGVDLINAGSLTPFPTKVIASPKLDDMFVALRKEYDYVIVDTAPILLVTDAMLCNRFVDCFLFVVAQHVSKKKDVANAMKMLSDNGINVIGTVMTHVTDLKETENVSGGYYYYYRHKEEGEK